MKNLYVVKATGPISNGTIYIISIPVDTSGRPTKSGEAELSLTCGSMTYKSVNVENALRHDLSLRQKMLNTIP